MTIELKTLVEMEFSKCRNSQLSLPFIPSNVVESINSGNHHNFIKFIDSFFADNSNKWNNGRVYSDYHEARALGEVWERRRRIAGALFEDLVTYFFRQRLPADYALFSGKQTLEFFKALYPSKRIIRHTAGLDTIEGIYVPDGLIVKNEQGNYFIPYICEYTLRKDIDVARYKYQLYKQLVGNHEIFSNSKFLYVVPRGLGLRKKLKLNGMQVIVMPFSHKVFGKFFEFYYKMGLEPIEAFNHAAELEK